MRFANRALAAAVPAATLLLSLASAQAAAGAVLRGHVPEAVATSQALGPVDRSTTMSVAIGLPLRNQAELENLLKDLVDPASSGFRQYLTPAQFADRFGPSQDDYQALAGFLEVNGLKVTGTHPNRMILDVTGNVTDIEKTFHVSLNRYRHKTRGVFFAPDREPRIDAGVTILDITGLDNYVVPRPMDLKTLPFAQATPLTTGSGPAGLFTGNDFRAAYAPGVTLNGSGQSVGLFELDGFYASDVAANFKQAGLPAVPVRTVLLDGFSGNPGSANVEVTLDIMMAAYMAPGATSIIVYEGTNWNDVLNRMATDNAASQLSSSWCFSPTNATTEQIFKQMIAQGQSLFQASGDSGAYTGWIMPPADDPNVTVVGGTSLTTAGAGGKWQAETTWSGSGGGVSTTWTIPSYQTPSIMTAAGGSASVRNIPDVAMVADVQIFLICNNGQWISVGGTSAAAPLWAGFLALANQQAATNKKPAIGFLNPIIYKLGGGSGLQTDLHDIVSGSNGKYAGLPGYDLATGWGSPAGQSLINDLTGASNSPGFGLTASASSLSIAAGSSGNTTITVNPQNGFTGTVAFTISGLPTGVTASFSPASAVTSSLLTLTVSGSAASGTANLTVTGTSGNLSSTVRLALTVTSGPSFTIGAQPVSVSLGQGGSATSTVTVTAQSGFNGTVALAASGLPSGVTASFSPASTTGSSTLTLNATATAASGTATVTITGTSGSLTAKATIALTVTAPPSFTLMATPASLSIAQGAIGTSAIVVRGQNGFSGMVALTASGLPNGVTASFNPASTAGASTVIFTASSSAPAATATVTIAGVSGSLNARTAVTLTIVPPPSFTLTASPSSLSIALGASGSSTLTLTAQNGFSGTVTVSVSGIPNGVTGTFSPGITPSTAVLKFAATASAKPGNSTVTITGTSGSLTRTTTISLTVLAAPAGSGLVSLAPLYNVAGLAVDGSTFSNGGLDGGGRAYSANLLGSVQTVNGIPYSFGPANVPGAVTSATIPLPAGPFSSLLLLATAVNGKQPAQTFTVAYTDGTTSTFTQSLSDWCTPQNYPGETKAIPMSYRNNSTGTRDTRPLALYGYRFGLSNGKTVSTITLPKNRNVVVLAISLSSTSGASSSSQVNLSAAFDTTGITTDGKTFPAGLDGVGFAYSGNLLGVAQTLNNTIFNLGSADQPNAVSGKGKTISLAAGKFSTLQMLATGVNGNQVGQTFKVTYTDGTSATYTQSLSDWLSPQAFFGESAALRMPYRNASYGAKDNRTFTAYAYSFVLNSSKTVSSITLPNNANVKVLAFTLAP